MGMGIARLVYWNGSVNGNTLYVFISAMETRLTYNLNTNGGYNDVLQSWSVTRITIVWTGRLVLNITAHNPTGVSVLVTSSESIVRQVSVVAASKTYGHNAFQIIHIHSSVINSGRAHITQYRTHSGAALWLQSWLMPRPLLITLKTSSGVCFRLS